MKNHSAMVPNSTNEKPLRSILLRRSPLNVPKGCVFMQQSTCPSCVFSVLAVPGACVLLCQEPACKSWERMWETILFSTAPSVHLGSLHAC